MVLLSGDHSRALRPATRLRACSRAYEPMGKGEWGNRAVGGFSGDIQSICCATLLCVSGLACWQLLITGGLNLPLTEHVCRSGACIGLWEAVADGG